MFKGIHMKICLIIFAFNINSYYGQQSTEVKDFMLTDAFMRHVRLRCLQQYPLADVVNYSDNPETHCYLHCFLYKSGLMDLTTRGLYSEKFINIWEKIEEAFEEDTCMDRFYFGESLNGTCFDTYRKLMEFRNKCLELFEYTFSTNSTWKTEDSKFSKKIGESASEFCDFLDEDNIPAKETSQDQEVTLLSRYKEKLKCIFENIHYLDAYGRVDESEIILSYEEAQEDTEENRRIIKICSHRANCKYQQNYLGNTVLELQKCLKSKSPAYNKVFHLRDENSRQY